jgi:hypothetical protein
LPTKPVDKEVKEEDTASPADVRIRMHRRDWMVLVKC